MQLLVCFAVVSGAAVLAFWPVVNNGFVNWDDQVEIYQSKALNTDHPDFFYAWKQPVQEIYKPVTGTVWWALSTIAYHAQVDNDLGTHLPARPFHVASLMAHALAGCMLFLLLRQLTGNLPASLVGAVFFVVHPLQTEAVAWASGLKDVLSGMFLLAALWQYTRFAFSHSLVRRGKAGADRRRYFSYIAATVLFVLAMLSKPSAVATPAVAMVIDIVFRKHSWRKSLKWLWPWFLLAIPIIIIGCINQVVTLVNSPIWFRPVVALDALAWHLRKALWPWPMAIDYGRSPDWLLQSTWRYFTWIVPVIVAGLAVLLWKRARWIAGGLAMMVVLLTPVLGLVTFSYMYFSTVADHYMYAALSGTTIMLGFAVARLKARWWLAVAAAMPAMIVISNQQGALWHDNQSLFTATLQANPRSFAGHRGLGHVYAAAHRLDEAERQYLLALETKPNDWGMNFDYGNLLFQTNRPAQAIQYLSLADRIDPTLPQLHQNLSVALSKIGQDKLAMREAGIYYQLLGEQFLAAGDRQRAMENFANAVNCDPSNVIARKALNQLRNGGSNLR